MIRFAIALLWAAFGVNQASAQTRARVMTGYAATSGPHAVLWIAREAGLFDKNGINAEVAHIRSGSTMAQTLVAGEIQMSQMGGPALLAAGALADPFTDAAKKLGYKEIADIAALGLEFPFVGIAAKKSYIKDNLETAQRFVRAYTEAIALYKNNRDLAMKVTGKYTGIKDQATLAATVDFYSLKLARMPYPTAGGRRFVKQPEERGFIKGLYPKG